MSLLMSISVKNWKAFNNAIAITGAIKGTSKLHKELSLESLKLRRKLPRLCTVLQNKNHKSPYLYYIYVLFTK